MLLRILALALLSLALAATPASAKQPNVFMLVVDEFNGSFIMNEKGRIDKENFPNLAKFGKGASWYRNHTTNADTTVAAVPSILTGQRPNINGEDRVDFDHNVFELLRKEYRIESYEPITEICSFCSKPKRSNYLAGAELDRSKTYQGSMSHVAGAMNAIEKREQPTFWFAHLLVPHVPWVFLPNGYRYNDSTLPRPGLGEDNIFSQESYPALLSKQRGMLQAQFADRIIGLWLTKLKRLGLWHNSMIIVLSDHGSDATPNKARRSIDGASFSQLAGVPMFVKYPNQRSGHISERASSHENILPTINAFTVKNPDYRGTTLASANQTPTVRSAARDANVSMALKDMIAERREMIREREQKLASPYLMRQFQPLLGRRVKAIGPAAGAKLCLDNQQYFDKIGGPKRTLPAAYLTADSYGLRSGSKIVVTLADRIVAGGEIASYGEEGYKLALMINPRYLPLGQSLLPKFYLRSPSGYQTIASC